MGGQIVGRDRREHLGLLLVPTSISGHAAVDCGRRDGCHPHRVRVVVVDHREDLVVRVVPLRPRRIEQRGRQHRGFMARRYENRDGFPVSVIGFGQFQIELLPTFASRT